MIAGAYAWTLLVSGALAFAFASLVFLAVRRPMFARRPRLAVFVATLPFAKLAVELARGIPSNAFFWEQVHGATRKGGTFQLGVGMSHFGPVVNLLLGTNYQGTWRPLSAADGAATVVDRHVGPHASAIVGLVLGAVALVLVVRELVTLVRTARECRRHAADGTIVETRRVGFRHVDVVVAPSWRGVPFASGFVRPRVCISEAVWSGLSAEEREAVVLHELGHVRWFDAVLLGFARVLAATLWFVPGSRAAVRSLTTQCELAADADAVSRGAERVVLASALVRTGELLVEPTPAPLMPLFRDERNAFVLRVRRLLDGEPTAKLGVGPVVMLVVLALTVLRMTTFGNP